MVSIANGVGLVRGSIKSHIYNVGAKVSNVVQEHPALASLAVMNLAALPVVISLFGLKAGGIYVMGSCPSMRNSMNDFIEALNLPQRLNEIMGADLVDNVTVPFGLKLKEMIEDIADDPGDERIEDSDVDVEDIEHQADKHALFELMGEINSDPDKSYDRTTFGAEYLERLAKELKMEVFKDEAITEKEILKLVKKVEIKPGQNIADAVVEWIDKNNLFEEEEADEASTEETKPVKTQTEEEGDTDLGFEDDLSTDHEGGL